MPCFLEAAVTLPSPEPLPTQGHDGVRAVVSVGGVLADVVVLAADMPLFAVDEG